MKNNEQSIHFDSKAEKIINAELADLLAENFKLLILAAAQKAKISRSTAYRWLDDALFSAELKKRRDGILNNAMSEIKLRSTNAAATLSEILGCDDNRVRRLAAKDLLEAVEDDFRYLSPEDQETRLDQVRNQHKRAAEARRRAKKQKG